jgi:hypothetical protein
MASIIRLLMNMGEFVEWELLKEIEVLEEDLPEIPLSVSQIPVT